MLKVEDLTKNYVIEDVVTPALRGVTFTIKNGEFVAIMGPSGSGKSTLLHLLSFLDRPSSGVYSFFGKHIENLSDTELAHTRNRQMGFIFQSFNLLGRSTVYQNVELPLIYSDIPHAERRDLVEKAVNGVGLEDKLHVEANRLSGGQKQRVAIARALVTDPKVIFADEPTGNLDSASGSQVMDILKKLHDGGRTIILVTHETYTAQFADRLLFLKDGLLAEDKPMPKGHRTEFFK
jgi:putative ABC transport system ATP-binding protein